MLRMCTVCTMVYVVRTSFAQLGAKYDPQGGVGSYSTGYLHPRTPRRLKLQTACGQLHTAKGVNTHKKRGGAESLTGTAVAVWSKAVSGDQAKGLGIGSSIEEMSLNNPPPQKKSLLGWKRIRLNPRPFLLSNPPK